MTVGELKALIESTGIPDDAIVMMEKYDLQEDSTFEDEVSRVTARVAFGEPSTLVVRYTQP